MIPNNEQGNNEPVEPNITRKDLFHNVFPVPHNVLEDEKFKKYTASIKIFFIYLCKLTNRFANNKGFIWRSAKMLKEDTGLNPKTIRAAKKRLILDDLIEFKEDEYDPATHTRHPGWFRVKGFQKKPIAGPSDENVVHPDIEPNNQQSNDDWIIEENNEP